MPPVISRYTQSLKSWWSRKTPLEKRVLFRCTIAGVAITIGVVILDMAGTLEPLEQWLYDRRAADCQYFNKPPSAEIVHIDIDDRSLDIMGRWPWPRSLMAQLLDEIRLAGPKAVLVDVVYSEPQHPDHVKQPDGSLKEVNNDEEFAAAMQRLGCALLPLSVKLAPPKSVSSVRDAMRAEMTANLELTQEQLAVRLRTRGFDADEVQRRLAEDYTTARRQAMDERLNWALDDTPGDHEFIELAKRLLPNSDVTIQSVTLRVMAEEYERVLARRAAARFGLPMPKGLPTPAHTTFNLVPVPQFSKAARMVGFADHKLFPDPVIRALPAVVESDGKLVPQFGFAFACAMLDADLTKLTFRGGRVIVPSPTGEITIPVRSYASRTLRRDVPLIIDIPWFGSDNWETMYDHPRRQAVKNHYPITVVWSICQSRAHAARNNENIDRAVQVILDDDPPDAKVKFRIGFDTAMWKRYAANPHAPEDTATREQIAREVRAALEQRGWLELLTMPDAELDPDALHKKQQLGPALDVIRRGLSENDDLASQVQQLRQRLVETIRGRGVLIGSIATAAADEVTTSLHARCPGVVVHGVIANAVLTGQWWTRAPIWVAGFFAIGLGLLTGVATGWVSPPKAAMVAGFLGLAYLVLNGIVLFDYGNWIVGAAGPLVAVCASWAGCSILRQVTELIERVRVARDLAVFRREMELAKKVQVALIPKSSPKIRGIESHGWTLPADITGGDCFDLWQLGDGRLGILLADASGHGLAPSMIVSQVRTLVRAMADIEPHPHGLLARVNARLADDLEAGRFVTAFAGYLDSEGNLTWASAGHGPVLWCAGNGDKKMIELESSALPLGIQQEWLADAPAPPLKLQPGGLLIVMSDGIFEAPAPDGEQFGVERCLKIFDDKCDASSVEIVAALRNAVRAWQAKDNPADDQTTVVVRRVDDGVSVTVSTKS